MRYITFDATNNVYVFGDIHQEQIPDFTILCQGYTFCCCRLLLRTWIPFFEKLQSFKEKTVDILDLDDSRYHPDIIHALLAYCHCRNIDLDIQEDNLPNLIEHAGYWEYDDFIIWLLDHYGYPDFYLFYSALQQVTLDENKIRLALALLEILEIPLQEESNILLTWLREAPLSLTDKILNHYTCPEAIREGYKLITCQNLPYNDISKTCYPYCFRTQLAVAS